MAAVVAFFLLGLLLVVLLLLPLAPALTRSGSVEAMAARPTAVFALAQGLVTLAGFGAATWVVGRKALRLDARQLRWRVPLGSRRGFGLGLVVGILPAALVMLLGVLVAGAGWRPDGGSPANWVVQVSKTILLLAPAALAEELMFRGLPMAALSRVFPRWPVILVLSLLFAVAHIRNPQVTTAALCNIALAGVLLSLAFYSPGGMWTAFGAHLGWNATLAALGAPVSGLPFDIPYIDYTMGGPAWLTGGAFGPEGGLLGTAALTGAVILVARWVAREADSA